MVTVRVEQVAGIIYEGELTATDAERINSTTGWTYETSAPLDHWIRHEGVVLSKAEMAQALEVVAHWQSEA